MQYVDNLNRDILRHPLHRFDRTCAQMGRKDDPIIASERAVLRQWLAFENIKGRAGNVAV